MQPALADASIAKMCAMPTGEPRQLSNELGREVRGVFAEPLPAVEGEGPRRALRRGWTLAADDRVVLVDDILTTGASLLETAEAVRSGGAQPLAAAVIVDRATAPFAPGFPVHALGEIQIETWAADACPFCKAPFNPGCRHHHHFYFDGRPAAEL